MEERITLKLSEETVDRVAEDPQAIGKYLYRELQRNMEEIIQMIAGYFFVERKRVYDLAIDQFSFEVDPQGMGRFTVSYTLGMMDGCSGIDKSQEDKMTITMNTNLSAGKMVLIGEHFPEREPDDF